MKKIYLFKTAIVFFIILIIQPSTINSFAQAPESFNYQAVVRDASGAVIASQSVKFRISILERNASGPLKFSETHSVTTNSFGQANLVIGSGTPVSGSISSVSWGSFPHYLKVELDPSGGSSYTILSTTQLLSVPYALHAKTAENDEVDDADYDPVNEIQTLSTNDTRLLLSPNGGSVPLSTLGTPSPWTTATPNIYRYPGKVGIGTISPQAQLHVNGDDGLLIQGTYGTGTEQNLGEGTRLHFYPKKAAFRAGFIQFGGWDDDRIGDYSTGIGRNARAEGYGSTAIGNSPTAKGLSSTAIGDDAYAEGIRSTAFGWNTHAEGELSTAMGQSTEAGGEVSFASGYTSNAIGKYSTSMGYDSRATGDKSTALGASTEADSYACTAIGKYNFGGGNATEWIPGDPIFEIGIGLFQSEKNALTVLKNGNVGIGPTNPVSKLSIGGNGLSDAVIYSRNIATTGSAFGGYFESYSTSARAVYGIAIATSGDTFAAAFNASASANGTGVWASGGKFDFYAGGPGTDYGTSSSKRWKENVVEIEHPLEKVIAIRGVFFDWDSEHGGQHDVGFIAEEVGEVLPEIVDYEENGIDAIGLDYSKLTPLLVEAVKALIVENENLKAENKHLASAVEDVKAEMESRLSKIEATVNTQGSKQ